MNNPSCPQPKLALRYELAGSDGVEGSVISNWRRVTFERRPMPLVDCAAAFASYRAAVAARVVKEINKRDGEVQQAQPFLKVGLTTPASDQSSRGGRSSQKCHVRI